MRVDVTIGPRPEPGAAPSPSSPEEAQALSRALARRVGATANVLGVDVNLTAALEIEAQSPQAALAQLGPAYGEAYLDAFGVDGPGEVVTEARRARPR